MPRLLSILVIASSCLACAHRAPAPVARESAPAIAVPTELDAAAIDAWLGAELQASQTVGAQVAIVREANRCSCAATATWPSTARR
jgi:hypothetical protein